MLALQGRGCHNINFVTPEHVVPQVIEAIAVAVRDGLRIPLVYNTSGYDAVDSLRLLDGIIDIYMPDFKFWRSETAARLSHAADYPQRAREALHEMHRQVGPLKMGPDGVARRGVLVRHLVMPGQLDEATAIFRFLAGELSRDTFVNIMGQYHPDNEVSGQDGAEFADIGRRPTRDEMAAAYRAAEQAGLWRFDKRWCQAPRAVAKSPWRQVPCLAKLLHPIVYAGDAVSAAIGNGDAASDARVRGKPAGPAGPTVSAPPGPTAAHGRFNAARREVRMSGRPFRFLQAGDLHLELPLQGLAEIPDHLRPTLIDAPFLAAEQVFETAAAEHVDFVVLTGDVLNPEHAGPRGSRFCSGNSNGSPNATSRSTGRAVTWTHPPAGRRRCRCRSTSRCFPSRRSNRSSTIATTNRWWPCWAKAGTARTRFARPTSNPKPKTSSAWR